MNYAMHVVSCSQPPFASVLCLRIESARVYLYLYRYLYLTFNLYAAIILMMVIPSTVPCSTLYSLPSSPQPLVSVLCCVSVVTYARWNHSVDTLSVCMRTHPEAPPTEAMRSGHKNFITYLFGPFNLSPYRDKPNNNNCYAAVAVYVTIT